MVWDSFHPNICWRCFKVFLLLLLLLFFCSFIIQVVKCHSKFQFKRPILSSLIDASKQTTAAFFHEDRSIIPWETNIHYKKKTQCFKKFKTWKCPQSLSLSRSAPKSKWGQYSGPKTILGPSFEEIGSFAILLTNQSTNKASANHFPTCVIT